MIHYRIEGEMIVVVAGLTAATSDSVLARRLEQGETELIEDFHGTL